MFNKKKNTNIKNKLTLSFIMVALIPIMILSIALFTHMVKLFGETRKYNEHIQNQVGYNVRNVLSETRKLVLSFHETDSLGHIAGLTTSDNLYSDGAVKEIISMVTTLDTYFSHIDSSYLYVENADAILSTQGVLDSKTYYMINEKRIGSTYDDWIKKLKTQSEKDSYGTTKVDDKIYVNCYYNLLRAVSLNKNLGALTLVATVSEDSFFYGSENISWIPTGDMYFFDKNGEFLFGKSADGKMLSATNHKELIKEKDNFLNLLYSVDVSFETTSWNIVSVNGIFNVYKTPLFLLIAAMLALILCLFLVSFAIKTFSKQNFTPIEKLAALLNEDGREAHYDTLINSVQKIIEANNHYTEDIGTQHRAYRNIILTNLLNGSISAKLVESLDSYGIVFPHEKFYVIACAVMEEDVDSICTTLEKRIEELFSQYNFKVYAAYDNNRIFCICNFPSDDFSSSDISSFFHGKVDTLCSELNTSLIFGFSRPHASVSRLSAAYIESLEALSHAILNNEMLTLYTDIAGKSGEYFTMKQENSIVNYMQAGNIEKVLESISEIRESFSSNHINHDYFSYDIICIFLKMRNIIDFSDSEELREIITFPNFYAHLTPPEEFFDYIVSVSEKICDYVNGQKTRSGPALAQKCAAFIDLNYSKQDLSVDYLSKELHCSSSHLTKIFKNKFGVSVYEYIQNVRIEEAKKLLETDMPISSVLVKVGYNNQRTFNRVFKSAEGVSPSEYRRGFSQKD